jgi:aryl-alcohol dehydrogenase-like predicted oxidoreductase
MDAVDALRPVADKAGLSMTYMAIAFTLAHPGVTSAIVGPRTMEQIQDLLAGADVRLDEQTLDAIDEIVPPGELIDENDRGYDAPWLEAVARRR